jgi:hypothetical protein
MDSLSAHLVNFSSHEKIGEILNGEFMKKLLIASLLTLTSMSSYAYEAKVICGGVNNEDAPQKIVGVLNKKIKEAIKSGYTNVSAPSIATGNQTTGGEVCVTVSKL